LVLFVEDGDKGYLFAEFYRVCMSIFFYNEDVLMPVFNEFNLQKVLKSEIRKNKCRLGVVNYIFVSNENLLKINLQFLNHDYYTDVITFDYSDDLIVSGDIYISTEMVLNNSRTFGQELEMELVRVMSHGLLHLLKFGDKLPEEISVMRAKEDLLIGRYFA
jgi:probable rRNA maturation factor